MFDHDFTLLKTIIVIVQKCKTFRSRLITLFIEVSHHLLQTLIKIVTGFTIMFNPFITITLRKFDLRNWSVASKGKKSE